MCSLTLVSRRKRSLAALICKTNNRAADRLRAADLFDLSTSLKTHFQVLILPRVLCLHSLASTHHPVLLTVFQALRTMASCALRRLSGINLLPIRQSTKIASKKRTTLVRFYTSTNSVNANRSHSSYSAKKIFALSFGTNFSLIYPLLLVIWTKSY